MGRRIQASSVTIAWLVPALSALAGGWFVATPAYGEERTAVLQGHSDGVKCLAFSPDSNWLATGSADRTVKVWDTLKGELRATHRGHNDQVSTVTFSADGKQLASTSYDSTIRLWDLPADKVQVIRFDDYPNEDDTLALTPNLKTFVQRHSCRSLEDLVANQEQVFRAKLMKFDHPEDFFARALALSRNGNQVAKGTGEGRVAWWDMETRKLVGTREGHTKPVWAVTFSRDGQRLASGGEDGTVLVWDTSKEKPIALLRIEQMPEIWGLAFSPDGKTLAVVGKCPAVQLWDVDKKRLRSTLVGHRSFIMCVAFSPDGKTLATGSWDRTARLWKVDNDK